MFEVVAHPRGGWTVRNTMTGLVDDSRWWPSAAKDAAVLWATARGAMAAAGARAIEAKARASGVPQERPRTWVHRG